MLNIFKKKQHKEFIINESEIESKTIKNSLKNIELEKNKEFNNKLSWITEKANKKPLMEIKDLNKSFNVGTNKKDVLKEISFSINEKENIAILGGNGAGKTTLVEILAGLNKPTSGTIDIKYDYDNSYLEKIGIQFQDSSYPPGISVKNVIDFMIDVYNIEISDEEMKSLLKIFAIEEFYNKRASSLSGGQQQRLNAFVAIIHKPKIIFLDELSTGLDISIRTRIKEFIKSYAKENNMSIVLVSHDMGEIEFLCDRVIFLKDGKKVVDVYMEDILKKYTSLEKFVTYYLNN